MSRERRKLRGKAVSGMMLTLMLIAMLRLAFNIQPVKASGWIIYIRADGSVDPDIAPISTVDNVTYTFTDNIHRSIVVERDNIVVDGAGYTLTWSTIPRSGTGIALSDRSNVTIKNMKINTAIYCAIYLIRSSNNNISGNNIEYNNEYGILFDDSSNNSILGNSITKNDRGILLDDSSNNSILGNSITKNDRGIYLRSSSNNTISGNNVTNNSSGIVLYGSSNNTLGNNDASNNKYNFGVYGSELSHYTHDIDDSNTVDGKPVYYWFNRQDMAVPLDLGWIALINCTRMTVKNLNLTNNGQGILLAFTTNSTITKNRVTTNANGVYLYHSSNNSISGNNITNNSRGVYLSSSSFNSVSGNSITNNVDGIYFSESSNNSIASNSISNNGDIGICLEYHSNNNTITRNNITNNGIRAPVYGAGICVVFSVGNNFHHNNFIDNWQQVFLMGSIGTWDDGYPSGGNYWSDYAGVDGLSGPNQDQPGRDGIGDTPYIIDEYIQDNYPLMKPFVPLLGDLNDDGRVDMRDIATAALAFGSYPSHPRWNPIADINKDNKVDMRDIATIAKSFGK